MAFIFAGGAQRSGTTLLQKFLCADPAANPKVPEASYLRALVQAYHQGKADFEHDTRGYFDDPQEFRRFNAGLVYLFLQRCLARFDPATHLVLKEPHLTPYFPDLFELVPEARFVLIVRDPRDVMASMLDVGERMRAGDDAGAGAGHPFRQRDIAQLANLIKSFCAPALNSRDQAFRQRLLAIRYEDLVRHTAEVQQRLRGFTGLALDFERDVDLNAGAVAPSMQQPRYAPWLTANESAPINDSSIGRYAQVLTPAEIAQAEQHCGDLMRLFQYPPHG